MHRLLAILVFVFAAPPLWAASCKAQSGPGTAALVELYTSEGCSSCPPADRWLSGLAGQGYSHERVVPLSLHVDYWDYIGWKDPYAQKAFSDRQRKLTRLQRQALVYTPQVMLQGRDFRAWGGKAFEREVARINAQPSRAHLSLEILATDKAGIDVRVAAQLAAPAEDPALYAAAYQNRLQSEVKAGENRGRTLAHDYVVLEWQGPFAFSGQRLAETLKLPLVPRATPADSGVAAFVQNRRTGEVLQALMRPGC
ncbi:MAG: DUF1223 domain-containing protein [Betaproteobacteria bacterium]